MTDPIRWSDSASSADPVIGAVIRYAKSVEPSPSQLARLATFVARAESAPPKGKLGQWFLSFGSRHTQSEGHPRLVLGGAFAAMAVGGVALAASLGVFSSSHRVVVAPDLATARVSAAVGSPREPTVTLAPSRVPVVSTPKPSRSRAAVVATAPATQSRELSLLTEARQKLRSEPATALALLGRHSTEFPESTFGEERSAARIEALYRLGQSASANEEYQAFVERFPSSIYRPRLATLRGVP